MLGVGWGKGATLHRCESSRLLAAARIHLGGLGCLDVPGGVVISVASGWFRWPIPCWPRLCSYRCPLNGYRPFHLR